MFCFLSVIAVGPVGSGKTSIINPNGGELGANESGSALGGGLGAIDEFSGFAAMSPRRKQAFFLSFDDEKLRRFKQRFFRIVDNSLINEGDDSDKIVVKKVYDESIDLAKDLLHNKIEFGHRMEYLKLNLNRLYCIGFDDFVQRYTPFNKIDITRAIEAASAKNLNEAKLYVFFFFFFFFFY